MTDWKDINQFRAPLGKTIMLCNNVTKTTTVGSADFVDGVPFPIFTACDPSGFGRFKATHWAEMPEAAQ